MLGTAACSLTSLDHLQGGRRNEAGSTGEGGEDSTLKGGRANAELSGADARPEGNAGMTTGLSSSGHAGAMDGAKTEANFGGTDAGPTPTGGTGAAPNQSADAGASEDSTMTGGSSGNHSGGSGGLSSGGSAGVSSGGRPSAMAGTGSAGDLTAGSAGAVSEGSAGVPSGGSSGGSSSSGGTEPGTGGSTGMVYGVPGQSCEGGLTCPGDVSCCTQIEVPAGAFLMGTQDDPERSTDESPEHTANVDGFSLDQFEVTVGRFRRFVEAFDGTMPELDAGAHSSISDSGWRPDFTANMPASQGALLTHINCNTGLYQTWTGVAGVRETMPMNCVSWYVAFAFCIWDGGRLPTEAEWEKAAANGAQNTRFPWGSDDPDPSLHAVMSCLADGEDGCAPEDLLPVGSRPAGANSWGHLDLAGSLWEWALDYYDPTYYQAIGTCNNCANLAGLTPRVVRGGDFVNGLYHLRATTRASSTPVTHNPYTGFRCARSL